MGPHREEAGDNFAARIVNALGQLDGAQAPLKGLLMAKMGVGQIGGLGQRSHLQILVTLTLGDGQGSAEGLGSVCK